MPFVQVADVSDKMNLVEDTKQKISILAQPMSVFAEKNSVLVTLQGSIGRVAITQYGAFVDRTVLIFEKYKVEIDKTFWAYIIKQKFIDEARKAPGGTIKTITKEALSDFDLSIPNYQEQKQIEAYFRNLDNLITLHQRKCALLFSPFQAFISMMFTTSTFSWEQRKAIDIADYSKGNGYSKGDLTDAGTPIILYGRLYTKYQFAISEVDTFAVPRNGAVYSQGNEVIVPASGETAEDIARASAVEKSGVLLGGDLNILRPFDFINPLFLALAISNGEPQKELAKKAQGKSVVHIHNTDIQEVTIAYPSRTEQDRIVSVFRQLDNLITLHQRKFEKLTNVKKSMLEKMFPQNGSSYPEIRFKGFTDPWEQRKFGEITSKYEDPVPTPHDGYYRLGIRSHAKGTFHSYVAKGQELETAQMHRVAAGNFIVNITFGWEHAVAITDKNDAGKLVSHRFPQFSFAEGMVPEFFRYVIVDEKFRHHLWLASPGGAGRNRVLKLDEMLNYLMRFPSRDEQIKIAEFFRHLDNLITLHQRKCIFFTGRAGRLISTVNKKRITSSWEQRKVGNLLIERNQQAPMSDEYPLMAFIANEGVAPKGERYDRSALVTDTVNKLYKKTEKGDFIYSSNNLETGSIGLNKYGKACISPVYSIFEPTGIADSDFLGRRLVRKDFINAMVKWRQGVIYGQWRIHESDFLKIEITVPSVEEQRKIGAYLDQLDNLITLHQRKPFLMKWRTSDANRNQTNRLVL